MAVELAELMTKSDSEVRELARSIGLDLPPRLGREKMIDAVLKQSMRRQQELEDEIAAERRADAAAKLHLNDDKHRPAPENVAILASKKWFVEFINMEQPAADGLAGADLRFSKGDYNFHLYDGRVHVLPACVVAEDISQIPNVVSRLTEFFAAAGLSSDKARQQAEATLKRTSLPLACRIPVYADRTLRTGEKVSVMVDSQARFRFQLRGEAPADMPFGVVTDDEVLHEIHTELAPLS